MHTDAIKTMKPIEITFYAMTLEVILHSNTTIEYACKCVIDEVLAADGDRMMNTHTLLPMDFRSPINMDTDFHVPSLEWAKHPTSIMEQLMSYEC